jgi:hypothetical protein
VVGIFVELKAKRLRAAGVPGVAASSGSLGYASISIVASWVELACRDFSTGIHICFVEVMEISTAWGLDRFFESDV